MQNTFKYINMICRVVFAHINRLFCIFIVILWIKFQKRDCADARCPGKAPRLSSRWTEGGAIRGQSPSNSTNAVGAMYPSKLCLVRLSLSSAYRGLPGGCEAHGPGRLGLGLSGRRTGKPVSSAWATSTGISWEGENTKKVLKQLIW